MLNKIKHSEHHLVAKIWKYKKCSYRSLWNPALNYLFNIRHNVLDNMVPYTFSFKLIIKFFFMSYHLWWMIYCWTKCKISLAHCAIYCRKILNSYWLSCHKMRSDYFPIGLVVRKLLEVWVTRLAIPCLSPVCPFCQSSSQKTVRTANEVRLWISNLPIAVYNELTLPTTAAHMVTFQTLFSYGILPPEVQLIFFTDPEGCLIK